MATAKSKSNKGATKKVAPELVPEKGSVVSIELKRDRDNFKKHFPIKQALHILGSQKSSVQGWKLSDINYLYKNNEIIRKPSETNNKDAEK